MNTINVNLKPCDCTRIGKYRGEYPHFATCSATPILIPCPIPRTVEMMVRVGECTRGCSTRGPTNPPGLHDQRCPARPIRVTCTIGGETWAGSEIAWTDVAEQECSALRTANARGYAERLVRDCLEIVKALVTGKRGVDEFTPPPQCLALMEQRDAVFEALADLVRLDTQRDAALARAAMALGGSVFVHSCPRAEEVLGQYVSHLIAKVSAL